MLKTVRHLAEQLSGIRAGTLSVGFVETFRVSVHGNSVAIGRMSSITCQGDRIVVTPFDPYGVPKVVNALTDARLNAYSLDPSTVAVSVPPVSVREQDRGPAG